jgi:hypothetical protein
VLDDRAEHALRRSELERFAIRNTRYR